MPRFLDLDEAKQNPDWQIVFGGGVNAGDAAAILWESKFEGAYGLWLLKTKRKPRPEQTDAMKHGNVTEPLIFEWYKRYKGMNGRSQVWAVHEEAEWVRGLGDFWNVEQRHGAEFKAPTKDDSEDHLIAKSGKVPFGYLLQCYHLCEVYDAATWDFVSWRSESDNAVIPVERNSEFFWSEMYPRYEEFWARVQANEWPEPTGTEQQEGEEWRMWAQRHLTGKAMEREAKEYLARADAGLKRLASAKVTKGAGIRATWSVYKPRWEVVVSADTADAQTKIVAAVKPLEGKAGVKRISTRSYPQNLVLKVSEESDDV
jgi:YqaJ-like viral recombinase domain